LDEAFEELYGACILSGLYVLDTGDESHIFDLSNKLRRLFCLLIEKVEVEREVMQDRIDEFAESACYELSMRFIEDYSLLSYTSMLPLIAKFIACQSAVAYSVSGVVDALDSEYRIQRIAGAYLAALLYVIQVKTRYQHK
jgi:hypothetical protein